MGMKAEAEPDRPPMEQSGSDAAGTTTSPTREGQIRAEMSREPRPGDILLFGPDGKLIATAIQLATHSHYHHSALYADDGMVVEARPKGVRCALIGDRDADAIHLRVDDAVRRRALAWARARVGDKYDDRSILLIMLDRIFPWLRLQKPRATRFSCASFVAEAYHQAGVDLVPGRRWEDLVPGDFTTLLDGGARPSHHAASHAPGPDDHDAQDHARHPAYA